MTEVQLSFLANLEDYQNVYETFNPLPETCLSLKNFLASYHISETLGASSFLEFRNFGTLERKFGANILHCNAAGSPRQHGIIKLSNIYFVRLILRIFILHGLNKDYNSPPN